MNPVSTRRQTLCSSLGMGLSLLGVGRLAHGANLDWVWHEKILQGFGTTLWIRAGHTDPVWLDRALDEAVQAVRQVERLMSLFDEKSDLSQLNARGFLTKPHPYFLQILTLSQTIAQKSAGAFDVTMQPIWRAWSDWLNPLGSNDDEEPPALWHEMPKALRAKLAAACRRVGWQGLSVSPEEIRLRPGMAVSLNGIAQGFASDAAKRALQRRGIAHAWLDVGEINFLGQSPAGPWRLGIESVRGHSQPPVWVSDGRAIATSSEAHTAFSADRRFHHIVNPRTGLSPTHWASVSVIAPSCTLADGLTKVFFMASPEQIRPLARYWGVDVLLQDKTGRWHATQNQARL